MILVTGARGVVGQPLIERLMQAGRDCLAVSRDSDAMPVPSLMWDMRKPVPSGEAALLNKCNSLIHCAPIWLLPDHIHALAELGITRVIAFSSTSVLSKSASPDQSEQQLVRLLSEAETALQEVAAQGVIELTIFRPSMIYGYGRDQNISHIAQRIRRLRFMPMAGTGSGLRQPVHADDLVDVAFSALEREGSGGQIYTVAGSERLSYRSMVERIFLALSMTPRIISLPPKLVRFGLQVASRLGGFEYTPSMADRMNQDLVYDNREAQRDLGFSPQAFLQNPARDLPHA